LTKPLLPLLMVVTTGQTWNPLLTSMMIGQVLRKIPSMKYEYLHVMCFWFGFLHTWLGVTTEEVEQQAGRDYGVLRLHWEWGFRDCASAAFMILIGASSTSHSSLGNEPSFTASFASGVAMRILLYFDFIQDSQLVKVVTDYANSTLRQLGMQVVTSDEMTVISHGGVGDCSGGPFESIIPDEYAVVASIVAKLFFAILPALFSAMWLYRGTTGFSGVFDGKANKRHRFPRICARLFLAFTGMVQVLLFLFVNLSVSHGGLINFWFTLICGIVCESYLSTCDVRGLMRNFMFILIFAII